MSFCVWIVIYLMVATYDIFSVISAKFKLFLKIVWNFAKPYKTQHEYKESKNFACA